MKQKYFVKSLILILINLAIMESSSWASSANTTTSSSAQQSIPALQIIEPVIMLNKQMVRSIKLVDSDDEYGRVELILTSEASKLLYKKSKIKNNKKLIFTINNVIIDALIINKEINKDYFIILISTSRKNIDSVMKYVGF